MGPRPRRGSRSDWPKANQSSWDATSRAKTPLQGSTQLTTAQLLNVLSSQIRLPILPPSEATVPRDRIRHHPTKSPQTPSIISPRPSARRLYSNQRGQKTGHGPVTRHRSDAQRLLELRIIDHINAEEIPLLSVEGTHSFESGLSWADRAWSPAFRQSVTTRGSFSWRGCSAHLTHWSKVKL